MTRANSSGEFLRAYFQRIRAKRLQFLGKRPICEVSHSPEPPRVGVAHLSAVVERQTYVGVLAARLRRRARRQHTLHTQMNEQRSRRRVAISGSVIAAGGPRQAQ